MNKLIALTLMLSLNMTGAVMANDSYTLLSCTDLPRTMSQIQRAQYRLKAQTPEGEKTLFDLQKEYDSKLSQASIVQELVAMNQAMKEALSPAGDPVRDIVQHIERVTQKSNISVYKNMAAMDALFKDLVNSSNIKLTEENSTPPTMQNVVDMCNSINSEKLLCNIARNSSDTSYPVLDGFLKAFAANDLPPEERAAAVNNYRLILNEGFPSSVDFEGIYDAAIRLEGVTKNGKEINGALKSVVSLESLSKGDKKELTLLKKVRCCQHRTSEQYDADPFCLSITDFQHASCSEEHRSGRQEVRGAIDTIVSAFSDYEQKTYDALNFKFDDIQTVDIESQSAGINASQRSFPGRIVQALGISTNETRRQQIRSEYISEYIDSDGKLRTGDLIEHHAEALKCKLQSIYRRGRINANSLSLFIDGIPQLARSTNELDHVAESLNKKICQIAYTVTRINEYSNCDASYREFVKTEGGKIKVANHEVIEEIFSNSQINATLDAELKALNADLDRLKSQISSIKGTAKFESLDKIKAFMAWDMKDRCGNDTFTNIDVASCQSLPEEENINYLLADVGDISNRLVAELSPSTIANVDITNASLAQRRVIFNNLTGACSAMSEEVVSSLRVPEIGDVCKRISVLDENVQQTTQTERVARLERQGYIGRDDRGRLIKRNSTWKDISIGAARALPSTVNTLLPTYFQGRQLSSSIPHQEQYYKNMKLYNYAHQWYLENTPLYPPMGFWNNYGANTGLYGNDYLYSNTGFNFNTSGI